MHKCEKYDALPDVTYILVTLKTSTKTSKIKFPWALHQYMLFFFFILLTGKHPRLGSRGCLDPAVLWVDLQWSSQVSASRCLPATIRKLPYSSAGVFRFNMHFFCSSYPSPAMYSGSVWLQYIYVAIRSLAWGRHNTLMTSEMLVKLQSWSKRPKFIVIPLIAMW